MTGKAIAGGPPAPGSGTARTPATTAREFFRKLNHPFWNFHYTLTSKPSPNEMALIGESRVADILANVLFPFWLAHDPDPSSSLVTSLWYQLRNQRLAFRRNTQQHFLNKGFGKHVSRDKFSNMS